MFSIYLKAKVRVSAHGVKVPIIAGKGTASIHSCPSIFSDTGGSFEPAHPTKIKTNAPLIIFPFFVLYRGKIIPLPKVFRCTWRALALSARKYKDKVKLRSCHLIISTHSPAKKDTLSRLKNSWKKLPFFYFYMIKEVLCPNILSKTCLL